MTRYKAIIFDLDGTLVDSSHVVYESLVHTLHLQGLTPPSYSTFLPLFGRHPERLFQDLGYHDLDVAQACKDFFEYQLAHIDGIIAYSYAKQVMLEVRSRGLIVGIYTNASRIKTETIMYKVVDLPITQLDIVLTGDEVARKKPDPEGLIMCANQLNLPTRDILYVGDASADIEAARAAQMDILLIAHGASRVYTQEPTYQIDSFSEFWDTIS